MLHNAKAKQSYEPHSKGAAPLRSGKARQHRAGQRTARAKQRLAPQRQ